MLLRIAFGILALCAGLAGQTQTQLSEKFRNEYQHADQELNAVYSKIMKDYADDAAFIRKLRAAQRAWIAFRDAHMQALYPASDTAREYGSIYPVCRFRMLTELTVERTKQLRLWTDGIEEGDTCNGSRRQKAAQGSRPALRYGAGCLTASSAR